MSRLDLWKCTNSPADGVLFGWTLDSQADSIYFITKSYLQLTKRGRTPQPTVGGRLKQKRGATFSLQPGSDRDGIVLLSPQSTHTFSKVDQACSSSDYKGEEALTD